MCCDNRTSGRYVSIAVCGNGVIPFFVCTTDLRYGVDVGHHGIGVCDDRQDDLERHDSILTGRIIRIMWAMFLEHHLPLKA